MMEVDDVETGQLLQRFGSMQTEDRSESIKQMIKLVGGEHALSESKATFYLEMSNWNVHAAVGHYFDLEASQDGLSNLGPMLKMTFVRDVTVGEGESVPPNTCFVKTWTIRNPGPEPWPPSICLKLARGHEMGVKCKSIAVPSLNAGDSVDVSVQMKSPDQPGTYDSEFRLSSPTGYFGDSIWCILTVDHAGTMALTQQLNAFNVNSTAAGAGPGACNSIVQSPYQVSEVVGFSGGQRPISPTDAIAQVSDVNPRNVLSRNQQQQELFNNSSSSTQAHHDEDEEMN